jgi:hypothetical protein
MWKNYSIVISIQTLQTNAEVGPTTTFHLEFLQSTCNVAMANTLIIEAKDVNNNTVTTYSGTINMTSSDTSSVLANNITMTLTNGIAARAVYFGIAGTLTVTLTDVDNSALTAIATVTVNPIHFTISVTPPISPRDNQ